MSLLRPSLLGAKTLNRSLSVWPWVLLASWAVLIRLQEPEFFTHQGIPFFWPSLQAMTMLVVGLLPLAWRLTQGYEAGVWTLRSARSTPRAVLAICFSVVGYGALLILGAHLFSSLLVMFTSHRISTGWSEFGSALFDSAGFLLVMASLAPALALTPWSTATVVFAWMPILAATLLVFGPREFSEPPGAPTVLSGIVSTLLATLGGLTVSLAHTHHRLRH